MRQYSFIYEALGDAVAKIGKTALDGKWAPARNAAIGAVAGGTINKMRGGSFTKGAAVGAVAGGGGTMAANYARRKGAGQWIKNNLNKFGAKKAANANPITNTARMLPAPTNN